MKRIALICVTISVMMMGCTTEGKWQELFNGKSFDFPYIRARSAANGLRFDLENEHLDMLHECRRIWRKRLPRRPTR